MERRDFFHGDGEKGEEKIINIFYFSLMNFIKIKLFNTFTFYDDK